MRRILVTGATGQIGFELVPECDEEFMATRTLLLECIVVLPKAI